jgi:hypothetical protein
MKESRFTRREIEISTSLNDFDVNEREMNERLDIEELDEEDELSEDEKIKRSVNEYSSEWCGLVWVFDLKTHTRPGWVSLMRSGLM